ncbi:hypothetical protein CLF_100972 [Clonorchis sinensis]|uniref:Uncharacterized protein n=1 Tax=Clonorchis sinensis TaxID=79923 RepID=G7Y4N8_CLOSI|nr:hypothetical protein CLF_100972 [Clonorchis sinensis]
MRRPGAAHSVAWKHQKRDIRLGSSTVKFRTHFFLLIFGIVEPTRHSKFRIGNLNNLSDVKMIQLGCLSRTFHLTVASDFNEIMEDRFAVELRILISIEPNQQELDRARRGGNLLAFLRKAVCPKLLWRKFQFNRCEVSRFQMNKENSKSVILLEAETSIRLDAVPWCVEVTESFLLYMNEKMRSIFPGAETAVDIFQEELTLPVFPISTPAFIKRNHKRIFETVQNVFYLAICTKEVERKEFNMFTRIPTSMETSERSLIAWAAEYKTKLKEKLAYEAEDIEVTPGLLVYACGLPILHAGIQMTSIFRAHDVDFPERWFIGLKGIISILDNHAAGLTNFKIPVYTDQEETFNRNINFQVANEVGHVAQKPQFTCTEKTNGLSFLLTLYGQ